MKTFPLIAGERWKPRLQRSRGVPNLAGDCARINGGASWDGFALGVEPIEEQLARYRRVTWALTVVPAIIGLMFLTLFTVFGRPDIGLIFDAIVLLPIVIGAWLDYALLARRARHYLAELGAYHREKELIGGGIRQERNDLGTSLSSFRGRGWGWKLTAHDQAGSSRVPAPTSSKSSASSS